MSAHDRIAVELRRRIFTGVYALGERLPAMHRLGVEFGVTEPVVGMAVAALRGAGLLRSVPSRGVWVVDEITDTARMRAVLDMARRGAVPPDWGADAFDGSRSPALVWFPASWIQRLIDECEEMAARLVEVEGGGYDAVDRMS